MLKTSYEFTLPRGYVDDNGRAHRTGRMRLATARDELEPLRDPLISGPDDPRLTILVLSRVIEVLGDLEAVSTAVIERLFAVDLAFLQDFYGVINFGTQEEFDALLQAQREQALVGNTPPRPQPAPELAEAGDEPNGSGRTPVRAAVEELPRVAL
ncbi:MAG TPA: hypothetical protein VE442_16325 [Jatrophihabitans sp.]|nr:hypothetical protein [Jatrophihabitans sp.]